jgi:hypothetical protein
MQQKIAAHLFAALLIGVTASAAPNASENFNSRKGTPLRQLKALLQNNCWTFHHFDINQNGWNPAIEGDGAMVADINALEFSNSGIYTPMLVVPGQIDVSFTYKFNHEFSESEKRWIRICLANAQNEVIQVLEEININGAHATKEKKYSTGFKNIHSGEYRLVLLYGGSGGNASIAIDNINTSAQLRYDGGCNSAPMAMRETVTGTPGRTASGYLIDATASPSLKAFLVKGSADGTVTIQPDGAFEFRPNNNFSGRATTFVYRICDESGANLCSEPNTIRINFPTKSNSQLVDFRGSYKYDGNVELAWVTQTGSSFNKFEVERSMDGYNWKKSGTIAAQQQRAYGNDYTYVDKVSKNTALKRDLYYRLRQVDADGTVSLSRLMVLRVYNTPTLTMISVTPNPLKKDLSVNVQLHESCYVSMRLRDESGNTVLSKIVEADKGVSNLLVEGSHLLRPGLYVLELIVNSKERMLVKLIKE